MKSYNRWPSVSDFSHSAWRFEVHAQDSMDQYFTPSHGCITRHQAGHSVLPTQSRCCTTAAEVREGQVEGERDGLLQSWRYYPALYGKRSDNPRVMQVLTFRSSGFENQHINSHWGIIWNGKILELKCLSLENWVSYGKSILCNAMYSSEESGECVHAHRETFPSWIRF